MVYQLVQEEEEEEEEEAGEEEGEEGEARAGTRSLDPADPGRSARWNWGAPRSPAAAGERPAGGHAGESLQWSEATE